MSNEQLFQQSCDCAASFPQSLVYPNTYDHILSSYLERLDGEEKRIFHDASNSSVAIRDYDDSLKEFESTNMCNSTYLKDFLCGEAFFNRIDPRCRFIFIHARFSRDKLKITRDMLAFIFTYHQVMPVFLDFLFPFGRQHHAQELHFSGFHFASRLSIYEDSLRLPGLGRSGCDFQMCYNLKAVEPSKSQTHWPWSIRQTAMYHSFDVENGRSFWAVIKGDQLIKQRIEAATTSTKPSNLKRFDSAAEAFSSSLATHLLLFDWCREHWRWYVNFLEQSLQESTRSTLLLFERPRTPSSLHKRQETMQPKPTARRFSTLKLSKKRETLRLDTKPIELPPYNQTKKPLPPPMEEDPQTGAAESRKSLDDDGEFSFRDLKRVQHLEEKANEVLQVLDSNIAILSEIREQYVDIVQSEGFPALLMQQCARDVTKFDRGASSVIKELRIQRSGTMMLLRLLTDRKSLLYGILEFRNMESNKLLASRSQLSTQNMESMTENMHDIALKTKQETVSMRIITLVTLFFLPGTFISTIMSTDIVQYEMSASGKSQKIFQLGALQLYLEITVPLMLLTFAGWYGVYWWVDRKGKKLLGPGRAKGGV